MLPGANNASVGNAAGMPGVLVRDNPAELQYELLLEGRRIGEIRYRVEPGAVALVHTEIDPAFEGQGLATQLVAGALRDLQARGIRVIPICPIVAGYIRRHPEYADLVTDDPRVPE
jgi:predicted GNAT family acetyltransferase